MEPQTPEQAQLSRFFFEMSDSLRTHIEALQALPREHSSPEATLAMRKMQEARFWLIEHRVK